MKKISNIKNSSKNDLRAPASNVAVSSQMQEKKYRFTVKTKVIIGLILTVLAFLSAPFGSILIIPGIYFLYRAWKHNKESKAPATPININSESIRNTQTESGYERINKRNTDGLKYFETTLIRCTKLDFEKITARQDNIKKLKIGDEVEICDSCDARNVHDTVLVTDIFDNEIGEISRKLSPKLIEHEEDFEYFGIVTEIIKSENGRLNPRIRLYLNPQ